MVLIIDNYNHENEYYSKHNTIAPMHEKLVIRTFNMKLDKAAPVGTKFIIADIPLSACIEEIRGDGFAVDHTLSYELVARKSAGKDSYDPIFTSPLMSGATVADKIDQNLITVVDPTIYGNIGMSFYNLFKNINNNPALPYSDEVKENNGLLNMNVYFLVMSSNKVFPKDKLISIRTAIRVPDDS